MSDKIRRVFFVCVSYLALLATPTAGYALDCSVTAMQFYSEAKRRGWNFDCINHAFPSLFTVRPTFIPKPPNQIACVAKLNQKSEMRMLIFRPRSSRSFVSGYLFGNWFLDGVPRHSLVNKKKAPPVRINQRLNAGSIQFYGTFPDGKTSMIVLDKFVLKAPRGSTCRDWKDAVNPRRG